ncbi:hypothetical protein CYMTET_17838, partial [Cymbomonas tetramitiformis]
VALCAVPAPERSVRENTPCRLPFARCLPLRGAHVRTLPAVSHELDLCLQNCFNQMRKRCDPLRRPSQSFLWTCKFFILQYSIVRPVMALFTLGLEIFELYHSGSFMFDSPFLWVTLINNLSVTIALYYLALFYHACEYSQAFRCGRTFPERENVQQYQLCKPLSKFVAIKLVIFFSFWQTFTIALLDEIGVIQTDVAHSEEEVEVGLADFLLCIEMLLAAACHHWVFSSREHQRGFYGLVAEDDPAKGVRRVEMCTKHAAKDMFVLTDVAYDVRHVAQHVYEKGKRRIKNLSKQPDPNTQESGLTELCSTTNAVVDIDHTSGGRMLPPPSLNGVTDAGTSSNTLSAEVNVTRLPSAAKVEVLVENMAKVDIVEDEAAKELCAAYSDVPTVDGGAALITKPVDIHALHASN